MDAKSGMAPMGLLKEAVRVAFLGVSRRCFQPTLLNIHVKAAGGRLFFRGNDLETETAADIKFNGQHFEACVSAASLSAFCSQMPADIDAKVKFSGKTLDFYCGGAECKLFSADPDSFPEQASFDQQGLLLSFSALVGDLRQALMVGSSCIGPSAYFCFKSMLLMADGVEHVFIGSSDGRSAVGVKIHAAELRQGGLTIGRMKQKDAVLVPGCGVRKLASALEAFAEDDKAFVLIDGKAAFLSVHSKQTAVFSACSLDADPSFPAQTMLKMYKYGKENLIVVDKKTLSNALGVVSASFKDSSETDRVVLEIKKNKGFLSSSGSSCSSKAEFPLNREHGEEKCRILSASLLVRVLANLPDGEVHCCPEKNLLKFSSENNQAVFSIADIKPEA